MDFNYKSCGLPKTMKIIGNRWTIPILFSLMHGKKRFNELQQVLGISPRTLSLRLSQLEKDSLISKQNIQNNSHWVQYSLTRRGRSLSDIIVKMCEWGER